ncbi:MAG: SpoVA/SpoVAEb family sporulation membrane protein [Clostridia bacterium]|nr:SpoVA/SpoVAEb family sporulation membrane protein [Clostridia bacterium]
MNIIIEKGGLILRFQILCSIISVNTNIPCAHFSTSLYFIIPHHRFNVNIFAKSLCPILTAAEGFILGVGAKIFTIAGPVILYGVAASVVYGVIYWIYTIL